MSLVPPRTSCTACASPRVTAITMTLTDGSVVDFLSCHACEHKTWKQSGAALDIATVLDKATKPAKPTKPTKPTKPRL